MYRPGRLTDPSKAEENCRAWCSFFVRNAQYDHGKEWYEGTPMSKFGHMHNHNRRGWRYEALRVMHVGKRWLDFSAARQESGPKQDYLFHHRRREAQQILIKKSLTQFWSGRRYWRGRAGVLNRNPMLARHGQVPMWATWGLIETTDSWQWHMGRRTPRRPACECDP